MVTQPPDLLVHSGNWQEHSFDSSVVTEGHYDASFESEVPPMGLSMDKENNGTTIIGGGPTTTSGNSMGNQELANIWHAPPMRSIALMLVL